MPSLSMLRKRNERVSAVGDIFRVVTAPQVERASVRVR